MYILYNSQWILFPLQDFVMGLSILLRGTIQEKLNWAFNLYDINKDGYITKEVCQQCMSWGSRWSTFVLSTFQGNSRC